MIPQSVVSEYKTIVSENYALILGDCSKILPALMPVDIVITSPPYNMRTRIRNGQYTEREWTDHFSKKYSGFHDAYPVKTYFEIHKNILTEIIRLSPLAFVNIQIVTGSKEAWFRLIGEFSEYIKDIIVWDKGEGQPAMHASVINRGYELILAIDSSKTLGRTFSKNSFARGTMPDIWRFGRGGNGKNEENKAQFPDSLVNKILIGWSKPNEICLDPFMGTGTSGVGCASTGRRFIGIEIDEQTFYKAAKRIHYAYAQKIMPIQE